MATWYSHTGKLFWMGAPPCKDTAHNGRPYSRLSVHWGENKHSCQKSVQSILNSKFTEDKFKKKKPQKYFMSFFFLKIYVLMMLMEFLLFYLRSTWKSIDEPAHTCRHVRIHSSSSTTSHSFHIWSHWMKVRCHCLSESVIRIHPWIAKWYTWNIQNDHSMG